MSAPAPAFATVFPVYSEGRRKPGRATKVHHWEIRCAECPGVNLRPSPFWHAKKTLQAIADEHNAQEHGVCR